MGTAHQPYVSDIQLEIATGLAAEHQVVLSLLLHQLVMGAGFDDLAMLQHDDPVAHLCQGQPMAHHHRHPPLGNGAEDVVNFLLIFGVQSGGGFVEKPAVRRPLNA